MSAAFALVVSYTCVLLQTNKQTNKQTIKCVRGKLIHSYIHARHVMHHIARRRSDRIVSSNFSINSS